MPIISINEQCQLSAGGFFWVVIDSEGKYQSFLASARLGGGAAHSIFFIHNVGRGKKKKDLFPSKETVCKTSCHTAVLGTVYLFLCS